jgi:ribosomal protein L34E
MKTSSVSVQKVRQHFITCSICKLEVKDLTYNRAHELMKEHFSLKHANRRYQAVESFGYSS